jgi:hypothetical protein
MSYLFLKSCFFTVSALALTNNPVIAQITNFDNSPLNYQNSPLNFDNSPLNFRNSPLNFDNSPLNYNATNGVYDNKGNRLGYEVRSPQGVTNIYDNKGNRTGYIPAPSR